MLPQLYNIYGNAFLQEADIVCIVDSPSRPDVQKNNSALINGIWNGHLLLVGLVEKTRPLDPSTRRQFKVENVKGWDIFQTIELKEFLDRRFYLICEIEQVVIRVLERKNWDIFFSTYSPLELLFPMVFANPSNAAAERAVILDLLEGNHLSEFSKKVFWLLNKAKKNYYEICLDRYGKIFRARQESLMQSIQEELELAGKKVLVLLEGSQLSDPALQAFLLSRKSIAICSAHLPNCLPQNMTELWGSLAKPEPEVATHMISDSQFTPSMELNHTLANPNSPSALKKVKTSRNLLTLSLDE